MAGWTNTVPQGAIGTGNAQVFDNPVAAQFGSQLQNLRRQEEIKAQQLAKQMRDNELAVSGGTLWADQVANLEKSHIAEGMELQKQGINPYTSMDPKAVQYRQARAEVTAKQKFRETAEREAVATKKFIRDNLDKLEPEDIKKYNDYLSNTNLDEAFTGNYAPPQIRTRFNSEEFDKNIKAQVERNDVVKGDVRTIDEGVNREETEKTVLAAYTGDGRGREQLLKVTRGLDPVKVKEDFAPTYAENKKRVLAEVEGIPGMKEALAKNNILPGTPAFEEYVSDTAEQYTKVRKDLDSWLNAKVDRVSSGVKSTRQVTPFKDPNEMTDYQRQSLGIQRQREARLAAGDSGSGATEAPSNVPLYFGKSGKEITVGEGVVKIPMPKKNFVGATAIDLNTGQPTKLTKSSNDYEVVSVGNYPILTKDATITRADGSKLTLKKGALVQANFAEKYPEYVQKKPFIHVQEKIGSSTRDRLVDYDYMPKGLTKAQNEALGAFKPATAQQTKEERKAYAGYKIGQTDSGYKYIGGDPAKPESWVKAK